MNIVFLTTTEQIKKIYTLLIMYVNNVAGIPGAPDPPIVEEIRVGQFEVRWTEPEDFGEVIDHYLLQYR